MRIEKTVINVIFDAGRGSVSVSSREAVSGESFGTLPTPTRSGYRFIGWFLDGQPIDENVTIESESDIRLVAQWEKKKGKKSASMLKRQKIAALALAVACVLLVVALLVVNEIVSWEPLDDVYVVNGEKVTERYYVKKSDGEYRLYDKNGDPVDRNSDGYYLAASGNQYEVNAETGEWSLYAVVDVEGTEVVGVSDMILIFPQLKQENIYSIEVKGNQYAPYKFYRDKAGNVLIEGTEKSFVNYDPKLFASLCVSCGYTISSKKLDMNSPNSTVARLPDGSVDYASYGLADIYGEDGTLIYTPTTYTITKSMYAENGDCLPDESTKYTVRVGDRTIPGGGFYVQLVGRDTIYILAHTLADTVLQPVESLVIPQVVSSLSLSTFLSVLDFKLGKMDTKEIIEDDPKLESIVEFSFLDLLARNNTLNAAKPYLSQTEFMTGYDINDSKASDMLGLLAEMEFIACRQLGFLSEDPEKFAATIQKFNLDGKVWYISFLSPVRNSNGYIDGYVENEIIISPKTDQGTYYVASVMYDMVVEVDQYYLSFLEWDMSDWYNPNFFTPSISVVTGMKFHLGGKDYTFRLDNSQSYMFYENSNGEIEQIKSSVGTVTTDAQGATIYVDQNGVKHTVRTFDLSRGGYKFRFINLRDGKNTVSYETFREYRFTVDRNGNQTLTVIREDKSERTYALTENGQRNYAYSLVYQSHDGYQYAVMGKYATGTDRGTVTDYYQLSYWKESAVTDETGKLVYRWDRVTFGNQSNALLFMDESDKLYEIEIGTKNLQVYCDQFTGGIKHPNLLDYTVIHNETTDKGTIKTETIPALENFRQFYSNLVGYTIEGDIDEAVFVQNMGMSSQEYIKTHACDASFSFSIADMAKNTNLYTAPTSGDDKASELQYWQNNNQMDIVIRFYRYSGRKVMMTVEVIEKYDENGNPISDPTKTVGRFYVLDSVLDMIEEDLLTLLDPTGKKVEMHD